MTTSVLFGVAALAAVRFAQGFARLRRRGRKDHAGWDRAVLFAAGLGIAVLPLVLLDRAADTSLGAHMLQHMLVGDAAPALILVSLRGPLLAFVLPAPLGRLVARLERLPAWSALGIWAAAVGAWHVPVVYDSALTQPLVHELEHASFAFAGFLVWTKLVDPARRRRLSLGQQLAFAGCLFAMGQILADVLFLSGSLYPAYGSTSGQQVAGLVMMGEQTLTLGTFAAFVLLGALKTTPSLRRSGPLPVTA